MRVVTLDFETFYDDECSVTELGAVRYTEHPRFEAYMVSTVWNLEGVKGEFVGSPEQAPWSVLKGSLAVAHNSSFEMAVTTHLLRQGVIPEDCLPDAFVDTADIAAFFSLSKSRSLDEVMQVFRVKMNKAPRAQAKGRTGAEFRADPELWKKMCDYCLEDSRACMKIFSSLYESWPENERLVAELTKLAFLNGIKVNVAEVRRARALLQDKIEECKASLPWVAQGEKPMSIKAFRSACLEDGLKLPDSTAKNDEDFQEFLLEYGEDYPWISKMGDLRSANRLEKVLAALERRSDDEGIVHVGLKYYGGHLGRWSGDEVNLQNLNKQPVFGIDLRGIVEARRGMAFVIFDFAQIEPRAVFWLVKEENFLAMVRSGINPYEAFARQSLGWADGKLKDDDKKLYALAKQLVISPAYGQGAKRMSDVLRASRTNIGVHPDDPERKEKYLAFSKAQIEDYRTRYWRIPELWRDLENEFRANVGQRVYEKKLPSGRNLYYYHLQERTGIHPTSGRTTRELWCSFFLSMRPYIKMWGGTLTENYIQALCRDIVAEAVVRIFRETGAFPLFTSHDEVVYEVPENEAKDWYTYLEEELVKNPHWAEGLPLGVEGMITDRYTK
jgi:DNA polymerase I-like protein with 3'-5' exonuclease and polymerase domains